VRTEWQGDEFAILVTRDEVVRARQRETLLDILYGVPRSVLAYIPERPSSSPNASTSSS
jgi:hypothetical protein